MLRRWAVLVALVVLGAGLAAGCDGGDSAGGESVVAADARPADLVLRLEDLEEDDDDWRRDPESSGIGAKNGFDISNNCPVSVRSVERAGSRRFTAAFPPLAAPLLQHTVLIFASSDDAEEFMDDLALAAATCEPEREDIIEEVPLLHGEQSVTFSLIDKEDPTTRAVFDYSVTRYGAVVSGVEYLYDPRETSFPEIELDQVADAADARVRAGLGEQP